jgi:N-acetylneuraminic acid mutarotase
LPGLDEGRATLLRDGRVLVTGGFDSQLGSSRETTLYDPHTGVWSATGSLRDGRHNHTATLLANGTVLVVGGEEKTSNSDRILASAELFDPATSTWTATGSLHRARQFHTATLLRDGRVLVAGGIDAKYNPVGQAELYDPASGKWTDAGTMGDSHSGHTATLLPDGKVLVAGGGTTTAELYDPATKTWKATGSLSVVRSGHAATLLKDGRVLVTGGANADAPNNPGWATAELYDPRTGAWVPAGAMSVPRVFHSATLLPGGSVLVAGGQTKYQGDVITASVDLYSPATGKWTAIHRMHSPRAGQIAVLLTNNLLLVAGGDTGSGATTATAELYNPGAGARLLATTRARSLRGTAMGSLT